MSSQVVLEFKSVKLVTNFVNRDIRKNVWGDAPSTCKEQQLGELKVLLWEKNYVNFGASTVVYINTCNTVMNESLTRVGLCL